MYAGFLTQKVNGKHRGSVYLKYKAGQERVIQMEDGGLIEHQKNGGESNQNNINVTTLKQ